MFVNVTAVMLRSEYLQAVAKMRLLIGRKIKPLRDREREKKNCLVYIHSCNVLIKKNTHAVSLSLSVLHHLVVAVCIFVVSRMEACRQPSRICQDCNLIRPRSPDPDCVSRGRVLVCDQT